MGFRVRDRVGIRDSVRASFGFGYSCFSWSKLELKICSCVEKQVHGIKLAKITPRGS